jgi:hypothetical protein
MSFSSGGQRQRWSFACREIRLARRAIPACGNALGKASWRTGIRFAWPFLFQREAFELRKLVFKRVRVTGVMNFAALRLDNKLWSTNDAPFVLFVARNEPSAPNDNFYYISPRQEPHLAAATGIATQAVLENEFSLKAIFKGGLLGLDLLLRLISTARSARPPSVDRRCRTVTSGKIGPC